jgi:KDO2-lipid IV(A) lauroyltransferase
MSALALRLVFALLGLLPVARASALGGRIARVVGPFLPVSRVARQNLAWALPERAAEHRAILAACWDNLGRTFAEYPHLAEIVANRVELVGRVHLEALPAGPALFFSAHFGNWELLPRVAWAAGLPLAGIYRRPNDADVDRLIARVRGLPRDHLFAKGGDGARQALAHLKSGGRLALLVDQKMNDGIQAPFFGRLAPTAPALAQLAWRFGCPVLPARVVRLAGARFRVEVEAPMAMPAAADRATAVRLLTERVNAHIEGWIRADPGLWLWPHRRWPREDYDRRR